MFDIRNHLDQLTIIKELSSEFVCECPVCNGHRLTVSKSTGAYSCWTTECPSADIREAIAPLGKLTHHERRERKYYPARFYEKVELARFPKPVSTNTAKETWYEYSSTQRVHRYYQGEDKFTIPYYNGSRGKGDRIWFPYRIDEVELYGYGKWVLAVEGEKCVEFARELGIVTLTWQGSSWTPVDFAATLIVLRSHGIRGICYYPDHDKPGIKKAFKLWQACAKPLLQRHKFPLVVVNPLQIWEQCPEGGDIADWVEAGLGCVQRIEDVANGEDMRGLPF